LGYEHAFQTYTYSLRPVSSQGLGFKPPPPLLKDEMKIKISNSSELNYRDLHKQKFTGVWSTYYSDVVLSRSQDFSQIPDSFYDKLIRSQVLT